MKIFIEFQGFVKRFAVFAFEAFDNGLPFLLLKPLMTGVFSLGEQVRNLFVGQLW